VTPEKGTQKVHSGKEPRREEKRKGKRKEEKKRVKDLC
jgi:hypothetical protein